MTAMTMLSTGASPANLTNWNAICWQTVNTFVRRLQMRIAKAIRDGKRGRAKALQRILTHSFYAKLLAIKRVTENSGRKTAGVDGIIWKNSQQKMQAVRELGVLVSLPRETVGLITERLCRDTLPAGK